MSVPTNKPEAPCFDDIHGYHCHGRERPGMPIHCWDCGIIAPGHNARMLHQAISRISTPKGPITSHSEFPHVWEDSVHAPWHTLSGQPITPEKNAIIGGSVNECSGCQLSNQYHWHHTQEILSSSPDSPWPPAQPPSKLFAHTYANRSGVTVEWLKEQGREPRPCSCDDEECEGWQMAHLKGEDWPEWSEYPRSDPRFQIDIRFYHLLNLRSKLRRLDWKKLMLPSYVLLIHEVNTELEKYGVKPEDD